ncbi:hypothetical protein VTI74DRAFT_1528 [Chaetomium olivicolor]
MYYVTPKQNEDHTSRVSRIYIRIIMGTLPANTSLPCSYAMLRFLARHAVPTRCPIHPCSPHHGGCKLGMGKEETQNPICSNVMLATLSQCQSMTVTPTPYPLPNLFFCTHPHWALHPPSQTAPSCLHLAWWSTSSSQQQPQTPKTRQIVHLPYPFLFFLPLCLSFSLCLPQRGMARI